MRRYIVGGWVRDTLLGRRCHDKDWVVVGSTPEELLGMGYTRVGADFPVFLHPETKEEHALARTERKIAQGHKGFDTRYDATVSLAEDLRRRDLTVNAIAMEETGEITDPFNGRADLQSHVLRHVDAASFVEDPLRVLRVARFAATLGFTVAPETVELMRVMAASGELDTLTPERVWLETRKAMSAVRPSVYFDTLWRCDALSVVFPEIAALIDVPQHPEYHVDHAYDHTMRVVDACAGDLLNVWAAVCHDLGKATTPPEVLPHHYGHEKRSEEIAGWLCGRLRVSNSYTELALLVARYHMKVHRADEMTPKGIVRLFYDTDAFRDPDRFRAMLEVCSADYDAHIPMPPDKCVPILNKALDAALTVKFGDLTGDLSRPEAIKAGFRSKRVEAVRAALLE